MRSHSICGETAKRFTSRLLLLVAMPVLFSGCMTIKQIFYTYDPLNFHAVDEGVLYRSAQSTGGDLEMIVQKYGIKSVSNLRGTNRGQNWYDNEVIVSQQYGLRRVDISMSAGSLPNKPDLVSLLDAFRDLPRPMLVHCKAGADRTGEAAAIFALDHINLPKWEASRQLHPYFGHVPDLCPAKTYFFNEIYQGETWARESGPGGVGSARRGGRRRGRAHGLRGLRPHAEPKRPRHPQRLRDHSHTKVRSKR